MDGEIDSAGRQGVFDFLDEDALGVERGAVFKGCGRAKGRILHAVAGGANDLDGDVVATAAQLVGDVVGLPERELGAARADANRLVTHRNQDTRGAEAYPKAGVWKGLFAAPACCESPRRVLTHGRRGLHTNGRQADDLVGAGGYADAGAIEPIHDLATNGVLQPTNVVGAAEKALG